MSVVRPRTQPGHPIAVAAVSKAFGRGRDRLAALSEISLRVAPGEFVCVVGASGSGKSTLLNLVAGLDRPSTGTIDTGGVRPALMFQEPALMPWLSAHQNVELPLRLRRVGRGRGRAEALRLLRMVGLGGFERRLPHELSGGMRQRVALARALAQDADVLLMDEPFAALDAITRDELHNELERLWQRRRMTVLFVTHNAREAVRLGDRVLVLSSRPGRVAAEFHVNLARPRRIEHAELGALATRIGDSLREARDGD
jgi:NitT/TauT family transport system ATP-binding protein